MQALGLVPSALPFGVSLYRDATGAGIIGIVCGVDLDAGAQPADATGIAVEVTLLDGQAVFPQYVVRVAGVNTPITPSPELGGDVMSRCRFQPTVCVAAWHNLGLVVNVRLDGPRTDASEAQIRQLLRAVAREVVANLATVPARAMNVRDTAPRSGGYDRLGVVVHRCERASASEQRVSRGLRGRGTL